MGRGFWSPPLITQTMGKGLLAFLSAIAQDERERITKRANAGRAAALANGGRVGRRPKLNAEQQEEDLKRLAAGESCRRVGRLFKVSHSTISSCKQPEPNALTRVTLGKMPGTKLTGREFRDQERRTFRKLVQVALETVLRGCSVACP